jgi:hypothetical protein
LTCHDRQRWDSAKHELRHAGSAETRSNPETDRKETRQTTQADRKKRKEKKKKKKKKKKIFENVLFVPTPAFMLCTRLVASSSSSSSKLEAEEEAAFRSFSRSSMARFIASLSSPPEAFDAIFSENCLICGKSQMILKVILNHAKLLFSSFKVRFCSR